MADKNKRKQASAEKRRRIKRRKILQSQKMIERMWAEDGMVRIEGVDGSTKIKTVKEAAQDAVELNKMFGTDIHKIPVELRDEAKRIHNFIENIVTVCRQAQRQKEMKEGKAELINNMFEGKTPDGKKIERERTEDDDIQMYQFQYPTLKYEEIRSILREKRMPDAQKLVIMATMHQERMAEKYGAAIAQHQKQNS
jgi:hypothetical protein